MKVFVLLTTVASVGAQMWRDDFKPYSDAQVGDMLRLSDLVQNEQPNDQYVVYRAPAYNEENVQWWGQAEKTDGRLCAKLASFKGEWSFCGPVYVIVGVRDDKNRYSLAEPYTGCSLPLAFFDQFAIVSQDSNGHATVGAMVKEMVYLPNGVSYRVDHQQYTTKLICRNAPAM